MGIISLISSKKGRPYIKFFLAAALFSYFSGQKSASTSQTLIQSEQSLPQPSALESSQPIPQIPAAKPLGNISFQSVKSDSSINAVIDSSQKLDSGNLVVKFHHNSNKEEPVSVVSAVRYELSKAAAKLNEEIKELSKKSYVYV